MDIKMTKLEKLEVGKIYADNKNRFFEICQVEDAKNPRDEESDVATLYTWERDYESPDRVGCSLADFAREQGVDMSKPFHFKDLICAMERSGYVVLPIYALYHGCIHYSTHDFDDRWDSGVVGVGFIKKINGSAAEESWMRKVIEQEVEEYDGWANGQTYDLPVFDEHEDPVGYAGERIILDDWEKNIREMIVDAGVNLQPEYREAEKEVMVILK